MIPLAEYEKYVSAGTLGLAIRKSVTHTEEKTMKKFAYCRKERMLGKMFGTARKSSG